MKTIGIIPARYASNRLPGKPLLDLGGKPMIQRVYEQAKRAFFDEVAIATDHQKIEEAVKAFGGRVIMTSPDHPSGTDRVAEALELLEEQSGSYDLVVNIQGDEPFIDPNHLNALIEFVKANPDSRIATLACPIREDEKLWDPNCVKVVFGNSRQALYFSRHPIPYLRNAEKTDWIKHKLHYQHVGVYAFRTDALREIVQIQPSRLELAESLEQLRWLEHDYKIGVVEVGDQSFGIDTIEDLEAARRLLKKEFPE